MPARLKLAGRATVQLNRAENTILKQTNAIVEQAKRDLVTLITERDPSAVSAGRRAARVKSLVAESRDILNTAYSDLNSTTRDALIQIARYGRNITEQQLVAVLRAQGMADPTVALPNSSVITALATSTPVKGDTMYGWWSAQNRMTQVAFRRVLTNGVVNGDTINDLAKAVRGIVTDSGKQVGGIFMASRREAIALVRTAIADVNFRAAQLTYQANSDLVEGWEFVATLDDRTCPECGTYDGQTYTIDDPDAPQIPVHFQCRCTSIPKLVGISQPERTTYEEWFAQQDATTQDDILGPMRGDLIRNGDATFSEMVKSDGSMVTLKDLTGED